MSNLERFESMSRLVDQWQPDFNKLAAIHGAVTFAQEASFAMQTLKENKYLAQVAMENQDSLRRAVLNVAAVGLTLSPVHKMAYLVPRKGQVCLDISYRGLVKIAADVGSIKWAQAELVYEHDEFIYNGFHELPLHKSSPLDPARGNIKGVFCAAKLHDGEYLVTVMSIDEVYDIRDRSEAWKAFKDKKTNFCPWDSDEGEMIKKTVIKRASKGWPMTDMRVRLDEALDVTDKADPIQIAAASPEREVAIGHKAEGIAKVRALLKDLDRTEEKFIDHLVRFLRRDVKKLEDLTDIEMSQAIVNLESWKRAATDSAAKEKNENAG